MYIKNQYDNVRIVRTGAGLDACEELQYRSGDDWVTSATFSETDGFMYTNKSRALSALLRRYPDAPKPCVYRARVRATAFYKNRDESYDFATEDEARAFIQSNRNFCYSKVTL